MSTWIGADDPLYRAGARADFRTLPGVARVYAGGERAEIGLDHPRAGESGGLVAGRFLVCLSILARRSPGSRFRPHRRHSPQTRLRPVRAVLRPGANLAGGPSDLPARAEEAGIPDACSTWFRSIAHLVRGSHGLPAVDREDKPVLIGDGPAPTESGTIAMTEIRDLLWRALVPD